MKIVRLFSIAFVSLLFVGVLQAQSPKEKGLHSISRNSAEAIIGFLASDALQGRKAGSAEGLIVGEYLISYLKELNIEPCYETYAQDFEAYRKKGERRYSLTKPNRKKEIGAALSLRNILGKIEGKRKNEYVIVGAHFDHLGVDTQLEGDQIYNGADDNASGVSAVLQLARAFAISGEQPERTVVFAFWDGEEIGTLGSSFFVENYIDRSAIKGYLNFDMIGRNNQEDVPEQHAFIYTAAYPAFQAWLEDDIRTYNLRLKPDFKPTERPIQGSDNVPFALHNIPILWYHTDGHPDYHQPGDHVEKLNWSKLVDITKASFLNLWYLANTDDYIK